MKLILLRGVLGVLLALALLDGALSRPHDQRDQHDQHNELSVRHAHAHRPHHRHHAHHVRQLCGTELSNALRHLCAGRGYNSPDNMPGSSSSRHGHRGLASECCHVGCTLTDLEQYCQPRKTPLVLSQSTSESQEATAEYESDPRPETGNHIRPALVEADAEPALNNNNQDQKAPPQPTVVGGKVGSKLNMPSFNASNMIQVGVLKSPLQFRTPVTIPARISSVGSH